MPRTKENLVGKTFGYLKVIKESEKDKKGNYYWECECLNNGIGCKHLTIVRGSKLKSGETVSCGCLRATQLHKTNQYDLSGEYGIGYTSNTDSFGRNYFYFDKDKYELIKDYCWHFNDQDYVIAFGGKNSEGKKYNIRIHRLIMNVTDDLKKVVDHKKGSKTKNDNRQTNLRVVTQKENAMNSAPQYNNKSGQSGVFLLKNKNKWESSIWFNNKKIHLGIYDDYEKAVQVRKDAEQKYFGEFAYSNREGVEE